MTISKEQIIEYFKSGIKEKKNFKIGIEHEKFLFGSKNNKRIDYPKVKEMFSALIEFGWSPIKESGNIVGLNKGDKNITLEPGNQIELSGEKLNNIHEACSESHDYLFELKQVTKKLDIKIVSTGFDPISKLDEIPNNPKQRYKLMTKDMPLVGEIAVILGSFIFFSCLFLVIKSTSISKLLSTRAAVKPDNPSPITQIFCFFIFL